MKKTKRFDCVQMKNEIQVKMLRQYRGMSDGEVQRAMEQELATSDSPVARFWRRITAAGKSQKFAETPAKYGGKRRQ